MRVKKRGKTRKLFLATAVFMPLVVIAAGIFAYFQMYRLESGILDVCATQQDAYVNLVLDQINLRKDRDDQEIIEDILGTLDASTNKYWTFSTEETMLFVKDVLETNKYKGFTTSTYFVSENAQDFLERLQLNRVIHGSITVSDREYVASGVMFEYGGGVYKLCLLTNRAVLLDNNRFLEAKTELWLLIFTVLGLLFILPMLLVMEMQKMQRVQDQAEQAAMEQNEVIAKMNERLANRDLHNTGSNLWKAEALPSFIHGLKDRAAAPVVLMRLHCATEQAKEQFLSLSHYTLDHRVLRFESGDHDILLIFVGIEHDNAFLNVIPLLSREVVLEKTRTVEDLARQDIEKAVQEVQSREGTDGTSAVS